MENDMNMTIMTVLCQPVVTHLEQFIEYLHYAQATVKKDTAPAVLELIKCRRQTLHKSYIAIKYMITRITNLSQMSLGLWNIGHESK